MRTYGKVTFFRSKDEIETSIGAAWIAGIRTAERQRLRGKGNACIAARLQNGELVQAAAHGAADLRTGFGESQCVLCIFSGERDLLRLDLLYFQDSRFLDRHQDTRGP